MLATLSPVLVQVNQKAHHVEYNRFYISDITSMVDIQEDYLKWFLSKAEIVSFPCLSCCLPSLTHPPCSVISAAPAGAWLVRLMLHQAIYQHRVKVRLLFFIPCPLVNCVVLLPTSCLSVSLNCLNSLFRIPFESA